MKDKYESERSLIQRLRDTVIVPPTSRRDFLIKYGGGLAAAMAAPAFPTMAYGQDVALPEFENIPESWKGSGEVVVVTWGGVGTDAQRKAWYEPFERLCGIKVIEAVGPDPAKVKAAFAK